MPCPGPLAFVRSAVAVAGRRHVLDRAVVLYFLGYLSFTGQEVLELHLTGRRPWLLMALEAICEWLRQQQEQTSLEAGRGRRGWATVTRRGGREGTPK
jgi:hypothetical protein